MARRRAVIERCALDPDPDPDPDPNPNPNLNPNPNPNQAHHGGNDVIALVASFLLIQLLRFGLSGHLPNLYGGESAAEVESHTGPQIWALIGFALIGSCVAGASYFTRQKVSLTLP